MTKRNSDFWLTISRWIDSHSGVESLDQEDARITIVSNLLETTRQEFTRLVDAIAGQEEALATACETGWHRPRDVK